MCNVEMCHKENKSEKWVSQKFGEYYMPLLNIFLHENHGLDLKREHLPFVDLLVIRNCTNRVNFDVFRNDTHT